MRQRSSVPGGFDLRQQAEDSCELVILGGFEAERFGKFSRGGSEPESVGVVGDDVIDGGEGAA